MAEPARKSSAVVVPKQLRWDRQILAWLVAGFFWLCMKSWRQRWLSPPNPAGLRAPVIYCVWHDHLLLAFASYDKRARELYQEKGLAAMVSASGDGAVLSGILAKFGIKTIRGSTSRRGPQALLEASRWLKRGYSIAITPDGPRGPSHKAQDGVIYLAQISGRPIVPVSNYASHKIRFRSWDRFQIPLPFARCDQFAGEPIFVPRDATEHDREKLRLKLETALQAITVESER